MDKIYLTEFICDNIRVARIRKRIDSRDLARIVGKSPAWMSKIEHHQVKSISIEDVKRIEDALDIVIPDYTDENDNTTLQLLRRIDELMEENNRLKELLMEKWKE